MGRKLRGWVTKHGNHFYVGLTLRNGDTWEQRVEPSRPGVEITELYADSVRATIVDRYVRGLWSPETAPKPQPVTKADETVYQYVTRWASAQNHETAIKDKRVTKRRLGNCFIGDILVKNITSGDVLGYVRWLEAQPSKLGGNLSARSVREGFDVLKRALDDAVIVGILPSNPCAPVRGKLPTIVDKDPTAREEWPFTHAEIALLCSDPRIGLPDRVFNAIRFFTGARFGEIAVLRWRDIDTAMQPLQRMTIQRGRKVYSHKEGATKTGAKKAVPIHPQLQPLIDLWRASWSRWMGRDPTPNDLVLPVLYGKTKGGVRNETVCNRQFKASCVAVGIRPRHQHATRHTFITLVQDDGADGITIRWITHAPKKSGSDGYMRAGYNRLCNEIVKYRAVIHIPNENPNNPNTLDLPLKTLDEKRMHSGIEPLTANTHIPTSDGNNMGLMYSSEHLSRNMYRYSPKITGYYSGEMSMYAALELEELRTIEEAENVGENIWTLDDFIKTPREQWPTWIDHAEIDQMIAERAQMTD